MNQTTNRIILHVDMDAFFVSVERALNPKLLGKPVIVGGSAEGRGVVSAASYEARAFGVHSAMPMATAKKRCAHAIFLSGTHHAYGEYSRRVFEILGRFTPLVEPVSIDEAYLDISGCQRLHRAAPSAIAESIHHAILEETSLPCSIGVASTRVIAKIAANEAKPEGLLHILPGYEVAFLSPLPVGKMPGVGPVAQQDYKKMGIRHIGDLLKFDPAIIRRMFGAGAEKTVRRARGETGSPITPEPERAKSIGKEVTYAADTDDPELLTATLSYLSERVVRRMRKAGLGFGRVTLKLRYADFNTITRSRTISSTAEDASTVFRVARDLLKSNLARRSRVRLVGVSVSSLTEPERQTDLFAPPASNTALQRSLDITRDRYGFNSVMTARSNLWAGKM